MGDFTVAIGNPFVLAKPLPPASFQLLVQRVKLENFENFIQTDAAINSGNSGGALVNPKGDDRYYTAILGPNGGNVGIGFAIPSNMMTNLTNQILEFGEVKRGMLGVQGEKSLRELADVPI